MKKILILIVMLLLYCTPCLASTISGVSGDIENLSELIISGDGFGTNDLSTESLISVIENGTTGTDFLPRARWSKEDKEDFIYSTSQSFSGDKSLYADLSIQNTAPLEYDCGNGIGTIYISWRARIDIEDSDTGQWKMFRISHQAVGTDTSPEQPWFHWFRGNDPFQQVQHINRCYQNSDSPDSDYSYSYWDNGATRQVYDENTECPQDEEWFRYEVELTTSGTNTFNGSTTVRIHRNNTIQTLVDERAVMNYSTATTALGRTMQYLIWQNYRGNGLDDAEIWLDDIFIQHDTTSRFELGNNSSYASCTQRFIQEPTAWADDEVTINLNTGTASDSETWYLFHVVDGVASSGYAVTVGASGSTTSTKLSNIKLSNITFN